MANLSLDDVRRFDPGGREVGRNWRFCCPLCGEGKPKNQSHQSLAVSQDTGLWRCWRCQETGKLTDFWTEGHERPRETLQRVPREPPTPEVPDGLERLQDAFARQFPGSPAEDYLRSRMIPRPLAQESGCGFSNPWRHYEKDEEKGWTLVGQSLRVTFPVYRGETLYALQGRAISGDEYGPKAITKGPTGAGCFVTPGALDLPYLIVAEGPINALSLAALGYPAVAVLGTGLPIWLAKYAQDRPLWRATDNDKGGNAAAERWRELLSQVNPEVVSPRLLAPAEEDWNDWIRRDWKELKAYLADCLD